MGAEITPDTHFPRLLRIEEAVFGIMLLGAILSFPLWIAVICISRFRLGLFEHLIQFVIYVAGCIAVNFSPVYEPTGLAYRLFYW